MALGYDVLVAYISIHALHEESDRAVFYHLRDGIGISIHALHEESDGIRFGARLDWRISIHALHEESDQSRPYATHPDYYFNPRSPCGERLD